MKLAVRRVLPVLAAGMWLATIAARQSDTITLNITPADTAALRQWDNWTVAQERAGALRVRNREGDPLLAGRSHEHLEQLHRGVRIFGAGMTRQWRDGQVETIFGRIYDGLSLSTDPTLTADDARRQCGRPIGRPELVIVLVEERPILSWRVRCRLPGDLAQLFVNAHTGRTERRLTSLHRQSAVGDARGVYLDRKKLSATRSGNRFLADDALRPPKLVTYDLMGDLERAVRILLNEVDPSSNVASDSDNVWEDGAVVDAHVYVGLTYDYYFKRFGRRGLDNRDTPVRTIVHPVTQEGALTIHPDDFGIFAINAFWCGECGPDERGMMLFGDGIPADYVLEDGQTVNFLSASLDITAHELTHGVTDYTSRLVYQGESGALNEAFSDIIGTSVEFFYQPRGTAIGQADYTMGEDSFRAGFMGTHDGNRSMAVPSALGHPDHYSERYLGKEDSGGVHINSSIVNHAFYLAVEGGPHRFSGFVVPGVGPERREQIEKAFYRGFTFFLPPDATFALARAATVQAARDLYGAGSPAEVAIATAWSAVGVQ